MYAKYAVTLLRSVKTNDTPLTVLKKTMRNHISNYKFSNDTYFSKNKPKQFNSKKVIRKVIQQKKGICMELHYTYRKFLKNIGFTNTYLVNCKKPNSQGIFYKINHVALITKLNGKKYFVDVGFGEYFTKPILIKSKNSLDIKKNKKLLLKVIDEPVSFSGLDANYTTFFQSKPADFPLCRILYERVFDTRLAKYIEPKKLDIKQ
ncbi:MAG: hypothetical protein Edafosvirus1_22 [Edafosvirus sp.]|uniref:Acetyltransferase n=1 Tax=Edafosvirus sp. TaxID=2487765 RepID=A0A3G4ZUL9_9VIRU|nr:MAG: hypothetical protein Edafosvirus1_22 [Edafosvirus sp.]